MFKKFRVTEPEKPVEFLMIIMYAKDSKRYMRIKQNPYLNKKNAMAIYDQNL